MAIVVNKAEMSGGLDKPLTTYNRTNAGNPNGSLTPEFADEIVVDTTNNTLWKAVGLANNAWVALTS